MHEAKMASRWKGAKMKYLALSLPTRLACLRNPDACLGRAMEELATPLALESLGWGLDVYERIFMLCSACRRLCGPCGGRGDLILDEDGDEQLVLKCGLGMEELGGICCQVLLSYHRCRRLLMQQGRLGS